MPSAFQTKSHFIELEDARLHVKRFYQPENLGAPVCLIHGAIENGKIFYSNSHRGFAPFLAAQGFDVYVPDLRGKGKSTPAIDHTAQHGQTDNIITDLPKCMAFIESMRGAIPQYWGAHSWGGVLVNSFLARFPEACSTIKSMVFFGCKRSVRVINPASIYYVKFFWNTLGPWLTKFYGYLPAAKFMTSADNESTHYLLQTIQWVKPNPWIDPLDDFDYGKAIQSIQLPPTLYFAGLADKALGHPDDVRRFMKESHAKNSAFKLLGIEQGYKHNYGHINMLTHPDAKSDHFVQALEWFQR